MYKTPQEILQILQKITLFKDLTQAQLDDVCAAATTRTLQPDANLFFQGEDATHLFLLLEGEVKLSQVTEDGQQIILHIATPGEAFGILAVLSEVPYPITAQAVQSGRVLSWNKPTMRSLMKIHIQLAFNSLGILAGHIHEYQDRFREMVTERVERRIARAILRLAQTTGEKTEEGIVIKMPLSRQDIAEMTGTTLYTASRILKNWESQGLVLSKREQVIITLPHGLVKIAEELTE